MQHQHRVWRVTLGLETWKTSHFNIWKVYDLVLIYISQAFTKTWRISIALIELSLINILAPPSVRRSTFRVIMIMLLKVANRVASMFI